MPSIHWPRQLVNLRNGQSAGNVAQFDAVVLLKGKTSVIAQSKHACLHHDGRCVSLATGGSGDALAGIVGGLAARGVNPREAAAWGTWVHGQAGHRLERDTGGVGFLPGAHGAWSRQSMS